jgi:hypothetical protein
MNVDVGSFILLILILSMSYVSIILILPNPVILNKENNDLTENTHGKNI